MPRKSLLAKEYVIEKGFEIVRTRGVEHLTARDLARELGTSTQPIFSLFSTMDDLLSEVLEYSKEFLFEFIGDISGYDMPFKRFGTRIVDFAREEPQVFDVLFTQGYLPNAMRDPMAPTFVGMLTSSFQLTDEEAALLYEQTMVFTYGVAQLCTNDKTGYYDSEKVVTMLSRAFLANYTYIKANGTAIQVKKPQNNN